MKGTAKTRNLERILNEELGTLAQPHHTNELLRAGQLAPAAKTRDLPSYLSPICVRSSTVEAGMNRSYKKMSENDR